MMEDWTKIGTFAHGLDEPIHELDVCVPRWPLMTRARAYRAKKRAQAIEAAAADETRCGSAAGESAVAKGDAPNPDSDTTPTSGGSKNA